LALWDSSCPLLLLPPPKKKADVIFALHFQMFLSCLPCLAQERRMKRMMMMKTVKKISPRNSGSYLAPRQLILMPMMNQAC